MKQITNEEMKKLIDNNYLRETGKGFIDRKGSSISYYRTKNKRYIEDRFVDIAKRLP